MFYGPKFGIDVSNFNLPKVFGKLYVALHNILDYYTRY